MKIINTIFLEKGESDIDFLIDALIEIKKQNLRFIKIKEQNDNNITIAGY